MSRARCAALACALRPRSALAGCESTQDKSARLAREGGRRSSDEEGLRSARQEPRREGRRAPRVLQDAERRRGGRRAAQPDRAGRSASVPVAIDVAAARRQERVPQRRRRARAVARRRAALLPGARDVAVGQRPGRAPRGRPRSVAAQGRRGEAGARRASCRASTVARPQLEQDPVSGIAAERHASQPLAASSSASSSIFAVARKGGRVVAAGRAPDQPAEARQARPLPGLLHRRPARRRA